MDGLASGRERGYLYVDWDGNVMPCVFAPYVACNIHEVHAAGGTLDDAWGSPLLAGMRDWQRRYASTAPGPDGGRLVCACPVRDHYPEFRDLVLRTGARPLGLSTARCLEDERYTDQMMAYGRDFGALSMPVLEEEYRKPDMSR